MERLTLKHSVSDLQEFKDLLNAKLEKSVSQIDDFRNQLKEISDNGKDENGIENSGYDAQVNFLMSNIDRATKHLVDIQNALLRINNGVYGLCTVTGKLIDKKRLLAVPTTTKSIEGKEILKQKS